MTLLRTLAMTALLSTSTFGQTLVISPTPLSVPASNIIGPGFSYSGTLTQAATIGLTASATACLSGATYCTNAAGVVVVAGGSTAVGGTTTFTGIIGGAGGPSSTWNAGALILYIANVGGVQLFPASVANGLGSSSPPTTFTLPPTSLSALGFPNFSRLNPTISLVVADTNYADNTLAFSVTQNGSPGATPLPGTFWLAILGLASLAVALYFRPSAQAR